jgi:hypothetical protein
MQEKFFRVVTPKAKVLVAAPTWQVAWQKAMKLCAAWETTLVCVADWKEA